MKIRNSVMICNKHLENESGAVLVIAILSMMVLTLLGSAVFLASTYESENSGTFNENAESLYIADAGIEHAKAELVSANFDTLLSIEAGVLDFGSQVNYEGGTYEVIVVDNQDEIAPTSNNPTDDVDEKLIIRSTGTSSDGQKRAVEAMVRRVGAIAFPTSVRAAISTNGSTKTNGTLIIDGRDHDINGDLTSLPSTGTLAISTTAEYTQGGDSSIGGTGTDEVDYPPSKPGSSMVVEENVDWGPDGYPLNPDAVLGLPEGTLKGIAQSGQGGSQYVTDPSLLTFPLSGVTYVELPSGGEWTAIDFVNSSGILVVHNSTTDAVITNQNTGVFKGLMIADDIVHIHTQIVGAIISLTSNPSAGNVIGNGSGDVLFSREAITNATNQAFGGGTIQTVYWREIAP